MSLTKQIYETLSNNGYKQTTQRDAVIRSIIKQKSLFSANNIITRLTGVDRVSIYRTIDLLTELDVIHPVTVRDGEQLYELHTHDKAHAHHIVCNSCNKTEKVSCTIPDIILKSFAHIHHTLALTGLCRSCDKKLHNH